MQLKIVLLVIAASLCLPLSVVASGGHDHGSHGEDYSKPMHQMESDSSSHGYNGSHGDHDGMTADGDMIIVGSQVSKGVKGMAHIKDVSEAMGKMGMKATHHFMVAFVDEESGEQIENGTVALKVTNPDAKVSDTVELIGMDGHFGTDLVLDMNGEYHFKLGTKLEDGKKRKYHFHYVND